MSMRDEFEAWYLNRNYKDFQDLGKQWLEKLPDGDYLRSAPSISWAGWQASRAALVVELPKVIIDDDMNKAEWEAARDMRERCEEAIQAAGIQVKS
nr:hypothetical protein [Pseudomonas luteola]